ncbi:hypothetical protein AVEN_233689-1 [Araneus ventricosus]|uniref:Uncharacterized protein n=1 Tax=Araneus ventricosus TaxID=182803 RepID=A0A4Y2K549_ARAVE|nr:hypothetical protein AVEN_233689-1 [Araneus ventricosus]
MGRSVAGCKIMFIFFNGNASGERGFSVNKTMLFENLKEQSLMNQRGAYDGIKSLGEVENVSITKRMLSAVRCARHRYRADLVMKKVYLVLKKASKTQEKRKLEKELQQLYNQKKKSGMTKRRKKLNLKKKFKFWRKRENPYCEDSN